MVLGWRSEAYYRLDPWRGTWAGEGGGVLVSQVTHYLDLFQWLMGPIVELFGYWENLNHPTIEVEDTAVAVLRFANGALGSIVASNSQKPGLFGRIHVHGTNGASVGVQVESGSAFISGSRPRLTPPINDIWTIPGEENLLPAWQKEDAERLTVVDIMNDYHRGRSRISSRRSRRTAPPWSLARRGASRSSCSQPSTDPQRDGAPVRFPLLGRTLKPATLQPGPSRRRIAT